MKKPVLFGLLVLVLIISACENIDVSKLSDEDLARISDKAVVCEKPYIRVGIECCLDQNGNNICDKDETTGAEAITGNIIKETEQKPACEDECSEDICVGTVFFECKIQEDGCKDKIEKGYTIGKCRVECLSNSDCKKDQKCSLNKCKEIAYSINQPIQVDSLVYQIIKAQTFTKMGTSMFKKETNGKFIKVYLKITNNAKESMYIYSPRFKLIDYQDRKFDRLSDDMFYIADYLEFGKQLQPNLAVSGAIVFEVPKDADGLKLEINGDWLSVTKVTVLLSDLQDIGTDTTLKDKQEEMWDDAIEEGEKQMDEIMGRCNSPFKCSSGCAKYSSVGQKDCPLGQVCCMVEQSEVDQQMDDITQEAQQQVDELMKQSQQQADELMKQYGLE